MPEGITGQDAASSVDADGGLKTQEGELRVFGVPDRQEVKHTAGDGRALRVTVAEPEGDEEASRPRARVDQ